MQETKLIKKYFPELTPKQNQQFRKLGPFYKEWNQKINVISRKDMENFYPHHVLHSLGIAKIIEFNPGETVLDVGTGGGFPGIPLAIIFPKTNFHLVDSIGKKITVVEEAIKHLELTNTTAQKERAENLPQAYDYIISRAVTRLEKFHGWVKRKYKKGIYYLKGGDLTKEFAEIEKLRLKAKIHPLKEHFEEDFFETKKIVYLSKKSKR